MPSINKATLVGYLPCNPEYISSKNESCTFQLKTLNYRKKKTQPEKTCYDYHTIVVSGTAAMFAMRSLKAGSLVYIEGELQSRLDDTGGVKKVVHYVYGTKIDMLNDTPKDIKRIDRNVVIRRFDRLDRIKERQKKDVD